MFLLQKKVFSHPGGEYFDGFSTHLGPSVKSLIGAATWKCERIPWGPTWKLMKRWEPEPRIFWWFDEQQFGCNQQNFAQLTWWCDFPEMDLAIFSLWLWLTVRHGIDGPDRNGWFYRFTYEKWWIFPWLPAKLAGFHQEVTPAERWFEAWKPG